MQFFKVIIDSSSTYLFFAFCWIIICNVLCWKFFSCIWHDIKRNIFECILVHLAWFFDYIPVYDIWIQVIQKTFNWSFFSKTKTKRKASPFYVIFDKIIRYTFNIIQCHKIHWFFKTEWKDFKFNRSSCKKCCKFSVKHRWITSCNKYWAIKLCF